ncbi:ScbR family autoregulator-binding transcription factor [Microbacterium rhizomatis]|uniref:TetR/AcrR family transcriptional regulator n=1 Tax=Microbacterium rhizomatis TaxID=1631477 RepID=A0A5J5IYK7_9MICO|nr:ScbR family autoregulator-binding transcription factor [Microbacterium rhizomatis]KAA9107522.1 TetR/AcrR family transcriptional regulator [Microbacterium rhizomatis]
MVGNASALVPPDREQERAKRTQHEILLAAASLFASRGYRGTRLVDIASQAGVTTGAFYFNFKGKKEVAHYMVQEQHRLSSERAQEIMGRELPGVITLMHLSASMGYDIITDPIVRAGTALSSETQLFPEVDRRPWEDWINAVRGFLLRGVEDGDVSSTANIDALAHLIGPAFAGVRIASAVLTQYEDLLERLQDLTEALIPAFAAPGRAEHLIEATRSIFSEYRERLALR